MFLNTNHLAQVRTKDNLRSMCLVSRAWKEILAPRTWEIISSNMQSTPTKTLEALFHPRSGILPHVRRLRIRSDLDPVHGEHNLRLLISALPRNALRSFESDVMITQSTLQHLLQSHKSLRILETAHEHFDDSDSIADSRPNEHMLWMMPYLSSLTALSFFARSSPERFDNVENDFRFLVSSVAMRNNWISSEVTSPRIPSTIIWT